jgi:hypothetical protein
MEKNANDWLSFSFSNEAKSNSGRFAGHDGAKILLDDR